MLFIQDQITRGNLSVIHDSGMKGYLWANGIAWKDYAQHVSDISQQGKRACLRSDSR